MYETTRDATPSSEHDAGIRKYPLRRISTKSLSIDNKWLWKYPYNDRNNYAFEENLGIIESREEDPTVYIRDHICGNHISRNHRWLIKQRYRQENKEKFDKNPYLFLPLIQIYCAPGHIHVQIYFVDLIKRDRRYIDTFPRCKNIILYMELIIGADYTWCIAIIIYFFFWQGTSQWRIMKRVKQGLMMPVHLSYRYAYL